MNRRAHRYRFVVLTLTGLLLDNYECILDRQRENATTYLSVLVLYDTYPLIHSPASSMLEISQMGRAVAQTYSSDNNFTQPGNAFLRPTELE